MIGERALLPASAGHRPVSLAPEVNFCADAEIIRAGPHWTTRVTPELTKPYGIEELHHVWFTPTAGPGYGPTITLCIPECETQCVIPEPDQDPLIFINRPRENRNVKSWLRYICKWVTVDSFCVIFACDTAEQAEAAARLATKLLPNHDRAALERLYEANTRPRDRLS